MSALARLLAAVGLLALVACGGGTVAAVPGADGGPDPVPVGDLPAELGGLRVQEEDVAASLEQAGPDTYVSALGLWSLRDGDLLVATLQVVRLAPDARPDDEDFRARVAGQIGQVPPVVRFVDGREVRVTRGDRQLLYVWFAGLRFAVLSISADHPAPRAMLRQALAVVA